MVAVVQLVEHQVVILAVAGSSPVSHPNAGSVVYPGKRRFLRLLVGTNEAFIHRAIQQITDYPESDMGRNLPPSSPHRWNLFLADRCRLTVNP